MFTIVMLVAGMFLSGLIAIFSPIEDLAAFYAINVPTVFLFTSLVVFIQLPLTLNSYTRKRKP